MAKEVGFGGADGSFAGGEFEVVVTKATEELDHVVNVFQRALVETDDIIQISLYVVSAVEYLVENLDEPAGAGGLALAP